MKKIRERERGNEMNLVDFISFIDYTMLYISISGGFKAHIMSMLILYISANKQGDLKEVIKLYLEENKADENIMPFIVQILEKIKTHSKLNSKIHQDFAKKYKLSIDKTYLEVLLEVTKESLYERGKSKYISEDIMSRFFTVDDKKGLGVVLTPEHIRELFCELANNYLYEEKSEEETGNIPSKRVLLDTCSGSGAFMNGYHKWLLGSCHKAEDIKDNYICVEAWNEMFPLLLANAAYKGIKLKNMIYSSSLHKDIKDDKEVLDKIQDKADICFINPPYGLKKPGETEMDFILDSLSYIKKGGILVAIVPYSVVIKKDKLKTELLDKHTLLGVFGMNTELFYPDASVGTVIMTVKAHIPHDTDKSVYFADWKEDGFEYRKGKDGGRQDYKGLWDEIKTEWIGDVIEKREKPQQAIAHKIDKEADTEWVWEAYVKTDYSKITRADFERELKKYAIFKLMQEQGSV
jgi:hypothetical protein